MAALLLMQNVAALLLSLRVKWKSMMQFRPRTPRALSLCMRAVVSHRSSRYHSGNWVTAHTISYINITDGHSYIHNKPKKKEEMKGGGCIRSHVGHFPPCTIHFQQGTKKKKKKKKDIRPCSKPKQKKKTDKNVLGAE